MTVLAITDDNHIDDPVEHEISACLNVSEPASFFLFAGAGSGKRARLSMRLFGFAINTAGGSGLTASGAE